MALAQYSTPDITDDYLKQLDRSKLIQLLQLKTEGLLTASRLQLTKTPEAQEIAQDLKKIQHAIEHTLVSADHD